LIGYFRGWPVRLGISVEPSQSGQVRRHAPLCFSASE
jgi:hypothetical protein